MKRRLDSLNHRAARLAGRPSFGAGIGGVAAPL
jgi:hypothetical protein